MDEEKKGKRVQAFVNISPRVPHFPGVGLNPALELFYSAPGALCIHSFSAVDFIFMEKLLNAKGTLTHLCLVVYSALNAIWHDCVSLLCCSKLPTNVWQLFEHTASFLHKFSTRQYFMDKKCVKFCKFT